MCKKIITIAIPVYNVEKYLRRCIDSIISQDIENCEILLIDDGSTDKSGEICDEYLEKYDCIKVIHQENRGLASVRNRCVQEAEGEYISFIDSDDYILPGAYAYFKKVIKNGNCDILTYGCVNVYEDSSEKTEIETNNYQDKLTVYSAQEAIDGMLILPEIDVITCNKVIRKSLYKNILYPVGKFYEDMFTNYKVIANAKIIISTNYKFYVYCHRGSSIGGMKFTDRTMDLARAVKEVHDFALSFCSENNYIEIGYLHWLIVVANSIIRSSYYKNDYIKKVQKYARLNLRKIVSTDCLGKTRKIQMIIFAYSFPLYKCFYRLYIKKYRQY